jgi:hypothetical protein
MSVTVGPLQDATVHAATATKNATVTAALVTKDVTVHATMATKEATVNAASSTSKGVSSGLSSVVLKAKMASRDQDLLFCKALFNFYIYIPGQGSLHPHCCFMCRNVPTYRYFLEVASILYKQMNE